MIASDVMVRDVITVGPEDEISDAVKLLVDNDISALPVVDAVGRLVGILSEGDLLRRAEIGTDSKRSWWLEAVTSSQSLAHDYAKSHGRKVAEVMSEDVISASADTPLSEVAGLLEKNRIKRIPIVENERLVGIVSRSNVMQALASSAAFSHGPALTSDRAIRLEVLAKLSEQPWTGFADRNVVVTNGIVHLWGLVGSPDERKALLALAEAVPGVRGVSDETIVSF